MTGKCAAAVLARCVMVMVVAGIAACGSGDEAGSGSAASRDAAATAGGGPAGAAAGAPSTAGATAGDSWNKAEVVRRLEEAGLVVADSGKEARNPALQTSGEELTVSGGQLQIYVYPDEAAREKDGAGLDTTRKGLPSIYDPIYIFSGNLIAILHTPKDRLAERVKLVLTSRHGG